MKTRWLIWLEWPERCFRVDAASLAVFRSLAPKGVEVVRVKSERAFLRALPAATHAVVWHFKSDWFARAKALRVLATPSAGRELIAHAAAPASVRVHFGGFHGPIMAETVAAYILAQARGLLAPQPDNWPRVWLSDRVTLTAGKRAVIVGYGRVGRAIGAKLSALGLSVAGFSRANLAGLPAALATCDCLVMALPSDTGTDDFLDRRLIAKLPRRAVVVNVGRGNSVNERDLFAALASGRLAGALLDVRRTEPQPVKSPVAYPPNLTLLPHASAFSPDYLIRCFRELHDDGLL